MAIPNVSLDTTNQNLTIQNISPVSSTSKISEGKSEQATKDVAAKVQPAKEIAENEATIAESKDGDLLTGELNTSYTQAEKTTVIAETEDGKVSKIEKVPEDEELITDLTGYSKTQVEQLYREGRISRYTYDRNMERREELQGTDETDKNKQDISFATNMSQLIGEKTTDSIETDALAKAADNGRTDIMLDIFTKEQKL